jgi:short subunit dehydrogenase-like uncharacterized protein
MNKEVVVYGASGYTGKLIGWHLAKNNIPFIAAGRNKARLEEQMKLVPELAGADYECVEVEHNEQALAALFTGKKVVYSLTGPFSQIGEPVVKACLSAGCHYLDTTGEIDWIMDVKEKYGEAFAAKNIMLCPASSWMWLAGQMAAEIALETPGIDTLDICYLADSNTSIASTKSFMGMVMKDQHYLENNQLALWPRATSFPVQVPGMHQILTALPWSGGAEPVWYLDDDRVANCSVLVAFRNQEMTDAVVNFMKEFEEKYADLSDEERDKVTNEWGSQIVSEEPAREDPALNRSIISCYARGNCESTSVILRGSSPYIQTGVFAAAACRAILLGQHKAVGFTSPAAAFGAREMMAAIAKEGLLSWEINSH